MRCRHVLPVVAVLLAAAACSSDGAGAAASGEKVTVKAGDSSCEVSTKTLPAGSHTFTISNDGSKVTEVYVYGADDKIIAEKENIGPGLSYDLTATLAQGAYEIACKPGMVGDGIRAPLTVEATSAVASADPAEQQAVVAYRGYVQAQVDAMVPLVKQFADAVKAGDVAKAKALYAPSRVPWESIEPVAESFGDLDPRVDLREADLEPGQTWTGWHRMEKALWQAGSTKGMAPVADQLVADIAELQSRVPDAELTVTSIGNGAKELLDEVATGKITGEEEAFSHTDLVDVDANVSGAQKAFEVLRPIVAAKNSELVATLEQRFAAVRKELATLRGPDGYVSYDTVDDSRRRRLAQVVDGLGEPLSLLSAASVA